MSTILLVEDNARILNTNKEYLESEGYSILTASALSEATELIENQQVDLIVLDIMLPDGMGTEFCKKIRKTTNIPILYLTCLDEDDFLVEALKAGGDEYMTKPYRLAALSARIMALLRRVSFERVSPDVLRFGELAVDCAKRTAYLRGEDLLLKPKEFDLLLLLLREQGSRFTTEDIYTRLWRGAAIDTRTVQVHISSLRKKLEGTPLGIITQERKYYSLAVSEAIGQIG